MLIQEFKDYEIIVSDDSTNNGVKKIVDSQKIPHLKYYYNSPALGSPQNWNHAISKASSKYIKILHHDDYFTDAGSLGKFVAALDNNPSADFAFCYSLINFKLKKSTYIHKQTKLQIKRLKIDINFLFFRNVIGNPSAVIFKNDKKMDFNKDYKWLVDVEFYIKYLNAHKQFVSVPEPLVTVVDGEAGQITQDITKNKKLVISENLNLFSKLYSKELHHKKSFLFFQELFERNQIKSLKDMQKEFDVPKILSKFITDVFIDWPKSTLYKKAKKRILTSRYNKKIFKRERF